MHYFIGVDISKADFAAAIFSRPDEPVVVCDDMANKPAGFDQFIDWLDAHGATKPTTTICVENAGVYSEAICHYLHTRGYSVCLEAASKVKRAFIRKGHKTDPLDAKQIAEYACRFHDQLKPFVPKGEIIEQLSAHLVMREQLIKQRTALKNTLQALTRKVCQTPQAIRRGENLIKILTSEIEAIEADMKELLSQNYRNRQIVHILESAPGVGPLTAINLLVVTNAFTDISEYKTFAAYLGICPLKHESGSSIKKPARSDRHGPPRMRKLLHLGARSTIAHYDDFKAYYRRKQMAGKPNRLIINNLSNKILRICCALVRDNKTYDPNYRSINPNLI